MRKLTCAGAILFGVLLLAVSPIATPAQRNGKDWKRCQDPNPDIKIGGCTAIIQSPGQSDANLAIAFYHRGTAYGEKGDYDRAIQDLDQAIRLNPNDANTFNNRGNAYAEKGDYDRAIQDLDQAIKLNPNDANAFNNRGNAYREKDDYDRAIQDYDQAVQLNPNSAFALNGRCWMRAILGDLQSALQDCNESLQLQSDASTFGARGFVYLKMKNADGAITGFNAALAIDPKMAPSLYGRGLAEHMKGDESASQADISAAVKLQPDIAAWFAKWGVPAPAAAVVSATPASK